MPIIDIDQASMQLPKLVDDASKGEEILIAKDGSPVARLVPVRKPTKGLKFGSMKGRIWIADDFDAPLPDDIQAAFEGK